MEPSLCALSVLLKPAMCLCLATALEVWSRVVWTLDRTKTMSKVFIPPGQHACDDTTPAI